MGDVTLSGSDTISLSNHVFNNLADGDCVKLTFPNDIANVNVGKNGNAIIALNENGRQAECEMRILRGSADDKFMNQKMADQINNFAGSILLSGQFVKKLGDGLGNIMSDTYIVGSGVVRKIPEAKDNVAGETDQSVSIWMIKFAKAARVIT